MKAIVELQSKEVVAVVPNNATGVLPLGQAYFRYDEIRVPFDHATQREVFSHDEIVGAQVIRHFGAIALTDQEIYEVQLDAGYLDESTGIKLKTTEYAQAKFSQLVTLISAAQAAGAIQPNDQQTIFDYNEEEHSLTVTALLALLLRYGFHCAQIFRDFAP